MPSRPPTVGACNGIQHISLRPLLIPMAVTGYAGFRQGTTAITNFLPGTRRVNRKGPVSGLGYLSRCCGKEVAISKNLIRLRAS
jgi:hypothetical protein